MNRVAVKLAAILSCVLISTGCAKTVQAPGSDTPEPTAPPVSPTPVIDTSADQKQIHALIVRIMRHGAPPASCTYVFAMPRAVARCAIASPGSGSRIFIARKYPWAWEIQNFRPALRSCETGGYHFSPEFQDRIRRAGITITQTSPAQCAAPGTLPPGDTGMPSDDFVLHQLDTEGDARSAVRAALGFALVQEQYEDGADLTLFERRPQGWKRRAHFAADAQVDARVLMKQYGVSKEDACAIAPAPRLTGRDGC